MLSVACPTQRPHLRVAPAPVVAGRGHPEPGPAVGNASAEPPSTTPQEWGCAWSPPEENGGEEPLRLPTFSPAAQVRVGVTFALFALSAGCNLAVLRAVGGRGSGRRPHIRLLLRHLAAADLLVTVLVMPLDAVWNITLQWRAGDLACRLLMYLRLLAMYASAFVTVVISLDRQAAILRPLAIARARARNRAMLNAAWILSAGLAVPQVPPRGPWDSPPAGPVSGDTARARCRGWGDSQGGHGEPCGMGMGSWPQSGCGGDGPHPALPSARAAPQAPVSAEQSRASAGGITAPTPRAESVPAHLGVSALASLPREVQTPITPMPRLLCQLFLFHTITLRPPHNFTQCTTRGSFPRPWHGTLYNMVGFACLFLLPLLIMVCCYARILLEISRRMGSGLCECPARRDTAPRPGEILSGALQGRPSPGTDRKSVV